MNNTNSNQSTEGKKTLENPQISNILVPIDFSFYSRRALEYAVLFARTFDAQIYLLNILEIPEFDFENITLEPPQFEDYVNKKIYKKLTDLAHQLIPKDVPYVKMVEVGVPGQKIVEVAKEKEMDLIIMATHGHSTLEMRIFGSVAQKVIRSANCPVISMNIYEDSTIYNGDEKSLQDIDDLDNQNNSERNTANGQ